MGVPGAVLRYRYLVLVTHKYQVVQRKHNVYWTLLAKPSTGLYSAPVSVQVLKEEKNLLDEFTFYEKGERENFSHMSNAGEE